MTIVSGYATLTLCSRQPRHPHFPRTECTRGTLVICFPSSSFVMSYYVFSRSASVYLTDRWVTKWMLRGALRLDGCQYVTEDPLRFLRSDQGLVRFSRSIKAFYGLKAIADSSGTRFTNVIQPRRPNNSNHFIHYGRKQGCSVYYFF